MLRHCSSFSYNVALVGRVGSRKSFEKTLKIRRTMNSEGFGAVLAKLRQLGALHFRNCFKALKKSFRLNFMSTAFPQRKILINSVWTQICWSGTSIEQISMSFHELVESLLPIQPHVNIKVKLHICPFRAAAYATCIIFSHFRRVVQFQEDN